MASTAQVVPITPPAPPLSPGERLALETGLLAGRLAELLRRVLPEDQAAAAGVRFLEEVHLRASQSRDRLADAAPSDHPLDRLTGGLGLSPCEVDLLLLAGLGEEHEGFSDILRSLHPQGRWQPTVGLAAQLFAPDEEGRRALRRLVETGPARRGGLFRLEGDGPLFTRSLILAEALWSALHGLESWPAGLNPFPAEPALWGLESWLAGPAASRAIAALQAGSAVTVLLAAEDPDVAWERAAALAFAAGARPVLLRWPGAPDRELEALAAAHALARGAVPVLGLPAPDGPTPVAVPAFSGYPAPVIIGAPAGAATIPSGRPLLQVPCDRLSPSDLGRLWQGALPALASDPGTAAVLAARYPVEPALAREVARDLACLSQVTGAPPDLDAAGAAVRARSGAVVGGGVQLVRPAACWSDLVLPPARLGQLREALDRLFHQARVLDGWGLLSGRRGARGVRALFAGPPGTGKTFTAEVLAAELGVDLLVVDLSRVVSKWIGETEKNLAEVFTAAERVRAVLLFDEADALFGKRTEVSDAHDRYANLETAYLLARLERFEGLAILSTNLRQNIDAAFTRRLEFVIDFDEPPREQRLALWRGHLPAAAPLAADVELEEVAASYPLVGGLIKNAATAAAFLAAAEDRPIGREHLLRAIRREYEKAGRAFPGPRETRS
jgi:ATPase family associated with various cellular activities (AAA)